MNSDAPGGNDREHVFFATVNKRKAPPEEPGGAFLIKGALQWVRIDFAVEPLRVPIGEHQLITDTIRITVLLDRLVQG